MSQPTPYTRKFSFTNDQTANPSTKTPGNQIDIEYNAILLTLNQTLANLALIQRDDGQLANNSVGIDQLKTEVNTGFNPPAVWVTAHSYAARDYAFVGANMYRSLVSHISGVFNTDLASGKWVLVGSFIGPKLASFDALNLAADQAVYFSDSVTAAQYALTSSGRALAGLAATGIPAITALGAATTRTITGTAQQITVTNGDGVSGNPILSLPSFIELVGKTIDQGTFQDSILTGSPTAPTVSNAVTNTNIATTAFVKSVRLDQMATPTANVAFGSVRITGLADPSSAQDAATKNYVDGIAQGLVPKTSVACATTANITLSGEQTIDGVLTSGSRVLVKNQTTTANNGIYVSAAGAWARATDMDVWAEVPGAYTFVSAGTTQATTGWICTSLAGGTLGSTAITFTQFSGAGTYSAGSNLQLVGTVFSVITSPSFTTPNLNVATATSINKVAITAPATGSTLTIADGKTLTVNQTLTFTGTTGTTFTFPATSGAVNTADSTATLTNKTFDTAGTGNSFLINGVAASTNSGTGAVVRDTNASLTTPALGVATATSINKVAITQPATSATLTITNLKTLAANNSLTLAGTDGTTITFQGTDTYIGRTTTDTLTNKTLTAPVISGGTATALTGLGVRSTGAAFDLTIASAEVFTAGRTLTVKVNDAARTIDIAGNFTLAGAFTTAGAFGVTLTATALTALTLPVTGTLSTLAGVETLVNKTLTSPTMTAPVLGAATATSINKMAITAPATSSTLAVADGKTFTANASLTLAGTDATTITFQGTDTYIGRATVDTITGAKTFNTGNLIFAGSTSGTITLNAAAIAGANTLTLPAATDTLIGKATTDTLTNKTFDTAGAGNVFKINGTAISAVTGTGAVVLAADAALTGNPTVPTQTAGNNSTRIASTAFVQAAISAATAGVASLGGAVGAITVRGGSLPAQELTVARFDAAQTLSAGERAQIRANTGSALAELGNVSFAVSASAGALTIALKDAAGNDPASATPVSLSFRNSTLTTSTRTVLEITAATSVVVPSTSTCGFVNAVAGRLWIIGWNDGGTFRLGVFNASSSSTTAAQIYALSDEGVGSSLQVVAAGNAAGQHYTAGAAVTAKAFRILGYVDWNSSGVATAGTWTTTNLNSIVTFGPGVKKPGDEIQTIYASTQTAISNSTTSYSIALTAPDITPTSAANLVRAVWNGPAGAPVGLASGYIALFQDATQLSSARIFYTAAAYYAGGSGSVLSKPNRALASTYTIKIKGDGTNACIWPGDGSGGGAFPYGQLILTEIMG